MKRTSIFIALTALILFGACGKGDDNANKPAPAPSAPAPAPGPTTPSIPTVGGCAIPLGGGQTLTQNGQPIYSQLLSQSGGFGGIPSSDSLTMQIYRQANNNPYGYQQYVNVVAVGQYQVSNPGIFSSPYGQPGMGYPYQQVAPQTVCVSSQSWSYAMVSGPYAQVQNLYLTGTINVPYYNYGSPYHQPQQATYPMPITMMINGAIDLYSSRLQGYVIVQTQQGAGIQYQAQ